LLLGGGKRSFLNKISKSLILTICPERTKRVPVFKTQTQLKLTPFVRTFSGLCPVDGARKELNMGLD